MDRSFDKDEMCKRHPDGCRLVNGGLVCVRECDWLARLEPGHLTDAKALLQRISDRTKKAVN